MTQRTKNQNALVQGMWNAECDRCSFKFKSVDLRKEWTGLMVCRDCYEPRHPQDFVRGVEDNSHVPWTRPDNNADTSITDVSGNTISTDNSPDTVGDVDKTLRVDGTPRMHGIQEWNTTLTANRTVTLNTTGARQGDRFTIYRTAGGAFDLIIGSLKTTSIKSMTIIEFNGSAWTLISYTPLEL